MKEELLGKYVVIRTYSAGVHAGYVKDLEEGYVLLNKATRIYKWDGAFTLSQMAMEGVKKPGNCIFSIPVDEILLQWIEIIPCTKEAEESILSVPAHKV